MSQLEQYTVDPSFHCHVWNGKLSTNGRGIVWYGRKPVHAYKLAYEAMHGAVPDGLVLEHSCRNILCVNPAHLVAVTKAMNERLKSMKFRLKQTHCAKGHALNESTRLITPQMGVLCRRCHVEER